MKRIEIIMKSKSYAIGYEDGKKETVSKILKFIDKECKFVADVHTDMLLDRLVEIIKKI